MSALIDALGFLFLGAAVLAHAFITAGGSPAHRRHHQGQEKQMPVSQDIQDFCASLTTRVQAAEAKAVADALAQVQQDHADEVAALKAALDQAAPPVA